MNYKNEENICRDREREIERERKGKIDNKDVNHLLKTWIQFKIKNWLSIYNY